MPQIPAAKTVKAHLRPKMQNSRPDSPKNGPAAPAGRLPPAQTRPNPSSRHSKLASLVHFFVGQAEGRPRACPTKNGQSSGTGREACPTLRRLTEAAAERSQDVERGSQASQNTQEVMDIERGANRRRTGNKKVPAMHLGFPAACRRPLLACSVGLSTLPPALLSAHLPVARKLSPHTSPNGVNNVPKDSAALHGGS
jgi:hypothetical protein